MKKAILLSLCLALVCCLLCSCSDEIVQNNGPSELSDWEKLKLEITTTVEEEEEEVEEDTGYKYTKYTSDEGRIVKVTYEGGTSFILNYNNFEITVADGGKTYTIGALDYVKIK